MITQASFLQKSKCTPIQGLYLSDNSLNVSKIYPNISEIAAYNLNVSNHVVKSDIDNGDILKTFITCCSQKIKSVIVFNVQGEKKNVCTFYI